MLMDMWVYILLIILQEKNINYDNISMYWKKTWFLLPHGWHWWWRFSDPDRPCIFFVSNSLSLCPCSHSLLLSFLVGIWLIGESHHSLLIKGVWPDEKDNIYMYRKRKNKSVKYVSMNDEIQEQELGTGAIRSKSLLIFFFPQ